MNRGKKIKLLLAFSIWIFFQSLALAGLSVDPVTLEVVAFKEKGQIGVFWLKNTSNKTIQIGVEIRKWAIDDIDIKNWLKLTPLEMELQPDEQKEIKYEIFPPKDSRGELRCMIFFIADELGEAKSPIGIRFGIPIYAVVGGTEIIDVLIDSIDTKYDTSGNVLSGTIFVYNKSNIHIRPYLDIKILNSKDDLVTKFNMPYGQPAQMEQRRPFPFSQNIKLAPGKYKLVAKVDYGKLYGFKDMIVEKRIAFIVKTESHQQDDILQKTTEEVKKNEEEK